MPPTDTSASRGRSDFTQRVFIVAGIGALALLLWALRDVMLLSFAAILIAIGLHGIADPIAKRAPIGSGVALAVAGIVLLGALIAIGWLFGAQIESQLALVSDQLPDAWNRLIASLREQPIGARLVRDLEGWDLSQRLGGALGSIGGYTMSVASAFTHTLLVIFVAVFFAVSPQTYVNGALRLLPHRRRDDVGEALEASSRALKRWLLGTLISMLAISVMVGVALWALGVPGFVALALVAGIAQFVPVVGPLLAAGPGILLALTVSPQTALWAGLAYFVASQLEANLLYPIIQQRAVSVPPALTLIAIMAMGVLFGPLGIVLATPVLVVAMILVAKLYVRGVLGDSVAIPGQQ